mgnify:FL=1
MLGMLGVAIVALQLVVNLFNNQYYLMHPGGWVEIVRF